MIWGSLMYVSDHGSKERGFSLMWISILCPKPLRWYGLYPMCNLYIPISNILFTTAKERLPQAWPRMMFCCNALCFYGQCTANGVLIPGVDARVILWPIESQINESVIVTVYVYLLQASTVPTSVRAHWLLPKVRSCHVGPGELRAGLHRKK